MSHFTLRNKSARLLIFLTILTSLLITGFKFSNKNTPPLNKVNKHVDKKKFSGEWFIISNIPYFAEKNKVGSISTYKPNKNDTFDDIFTSHELNFNAPLDTLTGSLKSTNDQNTKWQYTLYWLIKFDFEILYINEGYSIMLLGHKSRNYGWIMSRTNTLSRTDIKKSMNVFYNNDYDISRFVLVPQQKEQLSLLNIRLKDIYQF